MDHFLLIFAGLAVGAIAGLLGGLLGIGGGVVIVPALILLLDASGTYPPASVTLIAVATSLSCVLGTSLAAARSQIQAGKVQWPIIRRWGPPLVLGATLAGAIAEQLPMATLRLLIGGFLTFVAVVMLTSWKPHPHRQQPGYPLVGLLGTAGGVVSGLAGIGGGNVIVPTLIYFNTPVHNATANSSTLGVPIALAGVLGYLWVGLIDSSGSPPPPDVPGLFGYIFLPATVLIATTAMLTAPLGVRMAHGIDPLPLRRLFGLLLLVVAARMAYSALAS